MLNNKIKSLLNMRGIKTGDVANKFNMRYETASRKINSGKFTIQELAELMDLTNSVIVIQNDQGENLFKITRNDFIK